MKWIMEWDKQNCEKSRTSHLQVSCKVGVFKNFAKFTGILFFNKVASELFQNFMDNFFVEHLRTTASGNERLSFVQNL